MSAVPHPLATVREKESDTYGGEFTLKLVALVLPNFTAVAPPRLVPVMVTEVPPAVGPEVGHTAGDGGGRRRRR